MIRSLLAGLIACTLMARPAAAKPLDPVTYLLPAPENAIVFAPFLLAQHDGRYTAERLDVHFRVVPGGAHVGEAVARGEGDLGGAIGDTPILLRARNMPVRGVALLGHHSFVTLMTRFGLHFGPGYAGEIDVPSLQDTTNYALKAWLSTAYADPARVTVRALPSDAIVGLVGERRIDGMVGTVDWGVRAERQGARLDYRSLEDVYPAMAQAIMASDAVIKARPAMIRGFVAATLAAIRAIEQDPAASADAWRALVPDSGYSRDEVIRIFSLLRDNVYGKPDGLGRFDRRTIARAAAAARVAGLIAASDDGRNSFTNRFVGRSVGQPGK